jgi:hypothetical protein
MASVDLEARARASEACSATVVAYDRRSRAASTRATTRWSLSMGTDMMTLNNRMPSTEPNAADLTARSLAAQQNGATTSLPR